MTKIVLQGIYILYTFAMKGLMTIPFNQPLCKTEDT